MLELRDLRAGYEEMLVLFGVNLKIEAGDIVAVMGRNGSGKTTLMRAIMGMIKTGRSQILFEGTDISLMPTYLRARLGLAYVPQGRQIFPRLSVRDNLKLAAGKNQERISEILEKFSVLEQRFQAFGWSLSGGEQQILALARAMVSKPLLLLVDEPTEGIQPSVIDIISDEIRRMNQEDGVTVLVTEQNLDFAMELANRALLMHRGQIIRELTPEGLLEDKEVQAEYLGV